MLLQHLHRGRSDGCSMQGMGRHSPEEIASKLQADFDVCEALLQQSGAYLTGSTPTEADCILWAFLDIVRMLT